MARGTTEEDSSDPSRTNRRAVMETVGLAATAATWVATVSSRGTAASIVNLGEKGLSSVDDIDSPSEFDDRDEDGTGIVRNLRVQNDGGTSWDGLRDTVCRFSSSPTGIGVRERTASATVGL